MNCGFKVEYSFDGNQIHIIPDPEIPLDDFYEVISAFLKLGYSEWLPSYGRKGHILAKPTQTEDEDD